MSATDDPGYDVPPRRSVASVWALVLGVLGLLPFLWGSFVLSLLAVLLGLAGRKDVEGSDGAKRGLALARWGFRLGVAGIVVSAGWWLLLGTGVVEVGGS